MVDGLFLEVGLFDKHLARGVQYCLCGVQADGFDGVDDPLVDLVGELVEIDVLVGLVVAA